MGRCITTAQTVVERVSPGEGPSIERQTSFPEQDSTSGGSLCESHEQDRQNGDVDGPGVRISETGEVTVRVPTIGSVGGEIQDIDPNVEDITPQEFLDALIEKYRSHVEEELKKKRYEQAEDHQRILIDHLDERKKSHGVQYDWAEMQEKLADILEECGKINEAIEINYVLLQESRDVKVERRTQTDFYQARSSPQKALEYSRHCYKIAKLRFMQYGDQKDPRKLQIAETFARRSFNLRFELRKEHTSEFLESAELLAEIYQLSGNHVAADTCREKYLGSPTTSSCSLASTSLMPSPPQQSSLVGQAPVGDINGHYSSALASFFPAIRKGDIEEVKRLLQRGATVDSRCPQNKTPLMHATEHRQIDMVRLLCEKGTKVDAKDDRGWTALHHAVMLAGKGEKIVQILLNHKADCNATCNLRKTPLHYTVHGNNVSSACILLDHGANIDAEDGYRRTPLSFAESEGKRRLAKEFRRHEVITNR